MIRVLILVNGAAGAGGHEVQALTRAAADAGLDALVEVVDGPALTERARAALAVDPPFEVIAAGGGDGTVSAVAAALAGTGRRFAVLPLGTLNHFAKDLGIPADPAAALAAIAGLSARAVDVGDLNGRPFINNAVIGLYPDVVRDRDRQRRTLGRAKYLAHSLSLLRWLWRFPMLRLRLTGLSPDKHAERRTPCVFVGNNRYEMNLFAFGRRERLDSGCLAAYVVERGSRWGVLGLGLAALTGQLDQMRDFTHADVPSFTVTSRRRRLDVAMDGEVYRMQPPLHFRSRPGDLLVVAPPAT